jgi:ATP-dependent DNA helicase 2 subunit 2
MEALTDDAGEKHEALEPEFTINPVLQHFYQSVQRRALDPSANVAQLDPVIARTQHPDPQLFEKAAPSIVRFKQLFPLQKVEQKENSGRKRHWRDLYASVAVEDAEVEAAKKSHQAKDGKDDEIGPVGNSADLGVEQMRGENVEFVSQMNPVKDFRAMMKRRDDPTVQARALEGLQNHIRTFILISVGSTMFNRAIECLSELRLGCLQCEESEQFNSFLQEIKSSCIKRKDKEGFVKEMEVAQVYPIDSSEVVDSSIDPAEAKRFYGDLSSISATLPSHPVDADDLFDSLD